MRKKEIKRGEYPRVIRLTIDEKLSDDLFRILITRQKKGFELIKDQPEQWENEKEFILNKNDFPQVLQDKLNLTDEQANSLIWDKLKEGQVYLLGAFHEKRYEVEDQTVQDFYLDPKKNSYTKVFHLSKDTVKNLYLQTLLRSTGYGNRNTTK